MGIENQQVELVTEQTTDNKIDLDFGFEAEYTGGYTTISGKEQTDVSNSTGYGIADMTIGNFVTGKPEVTIFDNNDKDENGEYVKGYQSVRIRLIDHDEYVDLYANIPRRDDNGLIKNISQYSKFFRTGFDLVFSFMRFQSEGLVVDENGEVVDNINTANIVNICKAIDMMEYVKIKIVAGADENYDSWIILDMKDKI